MTWRCIIDAPRDGAANMAMDQALFEGVQAGGRPVLRLYRWDPPCLSLGRNQTALGVYDSEKAAGIGADIVRRPTGGLAVFHHRELTYAVVASIGAIGRPAGAYAAINRALATGLARLGAPAGIAGPGAPATPLGSARHPCFGEAARGEIVTGGRKLVGSAMRVEKRTLLQHGSILLEGDQSEVLRLQAVSDGLPGGRPGAIGLREAIGRLPDDAELTDAVLEGFRQTLGVTFETGEPTATERRRAREHEAVYRSPAWTWRR